MVTDLFRWLLEVRQSHLPTPATVCLHTSIENFNVLFFIPLTKNTYSGSALENHSVKLLPKFVF